jgi:hypothetical protein
MYKPLTGCEARLLRLKQTTRYEKRVAGDFMIVPLYLDVLPPYTALSYAWGSGERPDTITMSGMAMKVTRNLYSILQTICQTDATGHAGSLGLLIGNLTDQHMWIDAVCIYSYRTAMKRLGNLRFIPQFSEGFHFVSERKNSYSVLSRCTLYIPRTVLYPLPFSFRKGSEAALIGHVTERRGATAEYRGALEEHGRVLDEPHGALP